jgi:hypothetical protein
MYDQIYFSDERITPLGIGQMDLEWHYKYPQPVSMQIAIDQWLLQAVGHCEIM